jgi:tRNA(adenine34) deaminase
VTNSLALHEAGNHFACCTKKTGVPISPAQSKQDTLWMQRCLDVVQNQTQHSEVPIAAIIVDGDHACIAEACNQPIQLSDPTAHAEVSALRLACQYLGNYRLQDCTLYTTLEPCAMCFYALMHARISRIVFAASDNKLGILSKKRYAETHTTCNHHFTWTEGILSTEAEQILHHFFQQKR